MYKIGNKTYCFDYKACNRLTAIITIVCAILLAITVMDAHGYDDIDGYLGIPWGTKYSDMNKLLEDMDDGHLGSIACPDYICTSSFTRPVEFGGISFTRIAHFDTNKKFIGVRMFGYVTKNARGVVLSIITYTQRQYGDSDLASASASSSWSRALLGWNRPSGRMEIVHEKVEDDSIITITIRKGDS